MKNALRTLTAGMLVTAASAALATSSAPGGSYIGLLPCADCPGIDYRLDLLDDGVYHQSLRYQERDGRFDSIGRWRYNSDTQSIELSGADPASPTHLAVGEDSLTLLDAAGRRIDSALNYSLYRSELLSPIVPRLQVNGLFTYFADSASLHDCATGRNMPVAMERDYIQLERAWLNTPNTSLENPLPVSVTGRIEKRVNMESPARPTLIVESFDGAGEALRCTPPAPDFYGTEWRLSALDDTDIQRPAHLQFTDGTPPRVAGSTGCNRVSGSIRHTADRLDFGQLATTRMACPQAAEQERRFLQVLSETTGQRIQGRELQLLDASGAVRARFQAAQ